MTYDDFLIVDGDLLCPCGDRLCTAAYLNYLGIVRERDFSFPRSRIEITDAGRAALDAAEIIELAPVALRVFGVLVVLAEHRRRVIESDATGAK